jgi:hypothetical protein
MGSLKGLWGNNRLDVEFDLTYNYGEPKDMEEFDLMHRSKQPCFHKICLSNSFLLDKHSPEH